MELANENIKTLAMDHHGLVAATCKDLGIAEKINSKIINNDDRRIVTTGKAVMAMILNGLGFTNRRLYLTHQFFASKPTEVLLDENIQSSDITDYTLGHALDEIAAYGSSKLFSEIGFDIALENNLLGNLNHLDTTSISVQGAYNVESDDVEPAVIEVTHGHSKDHRPDLKQVVLSLVVNGPSAMPIFMEPLNGNSSDKASFHETIKKVDAFKKQINLDKNIKWVADSALYSKDKLLGENKYLWLTRVPETIREAKEIVGQSDDNIEWKELDKGYKTSSFASNYGDVAQRWLLVYSDQALHKINSAIVPIMKHAKRGKPKSGQEKSVVGYKIKSSFERDADVIK